MPEFLRILDDGPIRTITLHRPEKRNSLHAGLVYELHEALRSAGSDTQLRALVLTGAGEAFCAGADLAYLEDISRNSVAENHTDSLRLMDMMLALRTHPLPVIARLNGHAIAGGCGLALACDIVVAAEAARLGFPEVRIGFVPAIVGRLLTERVGIGRARELLIRGNLLSAKEAQAWGMVNHVVPPERLDETVYSIAKEIATQTSPQAVSMTRQLLLDIAPRDLGDAMRYGAEFNALSRSTADFAKGIRSFLEKKPPSWE
ncbi:MAG: enoyl-CoA hydratase-related protein [Bacteroidia bacterium]|nr:enoyl-CoA hydratase-related protein [Bacteroidia bacterium]